MQLVADVERELEVLVGERVAPAVSGDGGGAGAGRARARRAAARWPCRAGTGRRGVIGLPGSRVAAGDASPRGREARRPARPPRPQRPSAATARWRTAPFPAELARRASSPRSRAARAYGLELVEQLRERRARASRAPVSRSASSRLDAVAAADQRFSSIRQRGARRAARRRRARSRSQRDERVHERGDRGRSGDGGLRVGHAHLERPEARVRAQLPPPAARLGTAPAPRPSAARPRTPPTPSEGGTPCRGSSSAIFGRIEARPVSRPSWKGAFAASAATPADRSAAPL